jgi:hypothetical protein
MRSLRQRHPPRREHHAPLPNQLSAAKFGGASRFPLNGKGGLM